MFNAPRSKDVNKNLSNSKSNIRKITDEKTQMKEMFNALRSKEKNENKVKQIKKQQNDNKQSEISDQYIERKHQKRNQIALRSNDDEDEKQMTTNQSRANYNSRNLYSHSHEELATMLCNDRKKIDAGEENSNQDMAKYIDNIQIQFPELVIRLVSMYLFNNPNSHNLYLNFSPIYAEVYGTLNTCTDNKDCSLI